MCFLQDGRQRWRVFFGEKHQSKKSDLGPFLFEKLFSITLFLYTQYVINTYRNTDLPSGNILQYGFGRQYSALSVNEASGQS